MTASTSERCPSSSPSTLLPLPVCVSVRQEFPSELQWMSHLKEWHVRSTRISRLPDFLFLFGQLTTLQLPKNALTELPPEIGPSAGMHGLH